MTVHVKGLHDADVSPSRDESSSAQKELNALATARDQWLQDWRKSVSRQVLLGVIAYVLSLAVGVSIRLVRLNRDPFKPGDLGAYRDGLTNAVADLNRFVDADGVSTALALLQVVAALAIALIASRFPGRGQLFDAIAVTHWSERLRVASVISSSLVVAMAVSAVVSLVVAVFSDSLSMHPAPLPSLILTFTAVICVMITASSRVAGIDQAGDDLRALEIIELRQRIATRRQQQRAAKRRSAHAARTASSRPRRVWRWVWPHLIGASILMVWLIGSDWRSGLTPEGRDRPASVLLIYVMGWSISQGCCILLQASGLAMARPAWVTFYAEGRGKFELALGISIAQLLSVAGVLYAVVVMFFLPWSGKLSWDVVMLFATMLPGVFNSRFAMPRRRRQFDSARRWRPESVMEERVLRQVEEQLVSMDEEHQRHLHRRRVQKALSQSEGERQNLRYVIGSWMLEGQKPKRSGN